ncbi:Fc.00g107060.m01.CDS01 [Cosmosporella sp. VM-42]
MLAGASRQSTIAHITGLRILPQNSEWSKKNIKIVPLTKLALSQTVAVEFRTDALRDNGLNERPRADGAGRDNQRDDFILAGEALLGTRQDDQLAPERQMDVLRLRNKRRTNLISQWAAIRGLANHASFDSTTAQQRIPDLVPNIESDVSLRYTKGLELLAHVSPVVTIA